jgi:signal peptidase II
MIALDWSLAAVAVLAGDQWSKSWVLSRRPTPGAETSFLAIRCMLNRRGALAPFLGVRALVLVWAGAVAALGVSMHYGVIGHDLAGRVGLGALVGGATGNLVDRIRRGAIVDFIAVGTWPLFNVADAAIVAGIGLIALSSLR